MASLKHALRACLSSPLPRPLALQTPARCPYPAPARLTARALLQTGASQGELKRAYHGLIRQHHPDLHSNEPDAADACVLLNEVYAILSNEETRSVAGTHAAVRSCLLLHAFAWPAPCCAVRCKHINPRHVCTRVCEGVQTTMITTRW